MEYILQAFPIITFFGNMLRLALSSLKASTRYFIDARIALRRFKVSQSLQLSYLISRSPIVYVKITIKFVIKMFFFVPIISKQVLVFRI